MQTGAFKICPKCQQPAVLQAAFCGQCGRAFRTTAGMQAAPLPVTPLPHWAARRFFAALSSLSRRAKVRAACALTLLFLFTLPRFLPHTLTMQEAQQVDIGMDQASVENHIGSPDKRLGNQAFYNLTDGSSLLIIYEAEHVSDALVLSNRPGGIDRNLHGRSIYGGGERARNAFPAGW